MKKQLWPLLAAAIAAATLVGGAGSSSATPSFDRGLPTAHLNNAAGADRSNVAWSNGNDYISGDDFTLGSTGQTWVITQIRTWNIGPLGTPFADAFSNVTLYFGASTIAPVVAEDTHTAVMYADGSNYQTTSGSERQIWQNDFENLNLTVNGGQKYYFAVDGTATGGGYWFNHASNSDLSGSPQQGADGKWIAWAKNDLATPNLCDSGAPSGGVCDGGWDKSSDINVQVFASQVATSKEGCKDDGWQTLVRSDRSSFKNQGDCIQYMNTGK